MKAYLFISSEKKQYAVFQAYLAALGKMCDITSALPEADIVLIIGAWSTKGALLARQSRKMGIPYIVCPLGDLSARNKKSPFLKRAIQVAAYQKRMCRNADLVIATTPMERDYLTRLGWSKGVILLRYFNYTHAITDGEMVATMREMGATTLTLFEQRKAEMIASKTQDAIITQIMQIQSRMPHKNIPRKYLDDLHTLLYADNYDEDVLNAELSALKLTSFAASVFQAMSEETGLTEGFMPLPAKKGSKSKQILKYVSPLNL